MSFDIFYNPVVSRKKMHEYGYMWNGMVAVNASTALELFDSEQINVYVLLDDNSEYAIHGADEIARNMDKLFGYHREDIDRLISVCYTSCEIILIKTYYDQQIRDREERNANVHNERFLRGVYNAAYLYDCNLYEC